jgi:hypothetical protein
LIPETVGGLPTHALIVHFVVVLMPLSILAFAGTGWRADLRRVFSLPVALLALAALVAAFVATESGEALQDRVRDAAGTRVNFGDHPEDGELARNVAILFALISIAFWAAVAYRERLKLPPWAPTALYGLGCLVGLLGLFAVISAGHSGSTLVWKDLGNFVKPK